jgi:pimeloyl-ACP methyl ester carboxylesterase
MLRRQLLATGLLGLAGYSSASKRAVAQTNDCEMHPAPATFVLVPGAWCGGFVHNDVAEILRRRGHRVFTPTLSGLGERSNTFSAQINLTSHITDILNVIRFNELTDIVLAGHSYGGVPISGAADQAADRISSIVYLDAFVPRDGQTVAEIAMASGGPPTDPDAANPAIPEPALSMPVPQALMNEFGIPESERWKYTPMPIAVGSEPIRLTGAIENIPRRTYVWASRNPQFEPLFDELSRDDRWRTAIVDSHHMLMIDAPEQTARVLEEAIQ